MAIGRISGSMLKSNLTRNGVDLAFETNILYLDVTNSRVGIGTSSPSTALQVIGTTTTTGLVAGGLTYPTIDGSNGQLLTTNGSGTLSFVSPSAFGSMTFVGDDSTGSTINTAETLRFTGGNNITTAVVNDVVTITGTTNINVNEISSTDSSAIQINDAVNISGELSVDTIDTTTLRSNDSSAIQVEDTLNLSGSLVLQKGSGQCVFSDTYVTRNLVVETATNETINLYVTVVTKSTLNKWYGIGSASCYFISGVQSPYLEIQRGKIYRFSQSDSSNTGHPLNIYYDEGQGRLFPDFAGGASYVTQVGTPGTSGAYTELYVNFPSRAQLFYQCENHPNMGGYINVKGVTNPFTFVGDDSTGFLMGGNETLKFAGGNSIQTTASDYTQDTITIALSNAITVNEISSTDSTAIQINDGLNVSGQINMQGNLIKSVATPVDANDAATKNYVDSGVAGLGPGTVLEITAGTGLTASPTNPITSTGTISLDFTTVVARVVADDSTGTDLRVGETIRIAGTQNITTAVSGDTLTITGPSLNNLFTVVGDDSTGTSFNNGETLKIAGTSNITTAVSGDTLTITGPNLSSFITASSTDTLTNKTIDANGTGNSISNIEVADFAAGVIDTDLTSVSASDDTLPSAKAVKSYIDSQNTAQSYNLTFVGDDSTGTTVTTGETIKIAGAGGITTVVSGDVLTITGANQAQGITVVGDDSTGTRISDGETLKIAGTSNITTAISEDTLTITGSKDINVNSISSGDSSAIQINDNVNVSGTFNAKTIVTNDLISEDSTAINVLDGMNVSGTLSADVLDVNEISSSDSSAIQVNNSLNASGTITAASFVTHGASGNITGVNNIEVNQISSNDSTAVQVADGLNVSGTLTAPTFVTNDISSGDSTAIQINDAVNISGILSVSGNKITNVSDPVANQDAATKNYVDTQLSTASTSFLVADDTSTITTIDSGETLRIVGSGSVTTSLVGDTITITGAGGSTNYTFIGDDSTGTTLAGGSTLQVLGGEGISTAVMGNVLTITNTSTQMEIDGGSAYSIYNSVSEVEIDGGNA